MTGSARGIGTDGPKLKPEGSRTERAGEERRQFLDVSEMTMNNAWKWLHGRGLAHGGKGARVAIAAGGLLASMACSVLGTTSPSPTPSAGATETFSGTLALQGASLYTFTVAQAGTVSVTLSSLSPSATSPVSLGLGTPTGTTTCVASSSIPKAVAGSAPQITVTENPGTYCVNIADVGSLTSPSTFSITITHS